MYSLLKKLEETKSVEITELEHAYRINGIIDLYKNRITVYDIVANKYDRLKDDHNKYDWCIERLNTNEKRSPFKKTEKGGVSYQEFKNTLKAQKLSLDGQDSEDYHWKQLAWKVEGDDLYFLFHNSKIKIGRSKDPKKRVTELSTGLSNRYSVYVFLGKGFMESTLHKAFQEFNTSREWFSDNERIRRFLTRYHHGVLCYRF